MVKGWEKIFQANGPPKHAGLTIVTYDKVHFKPKLVRTDKADHFILIKSSIY
jgi:hypothetical protein